MSRKKVNLSELKQTHGALSAPMSIEELTGQTAGYSVASLEDYRQLLAGMTDEEMQEHAVEVANIVPVKIRSLLVDRLESKFVSAKQSRPPATPPSSMSREAQEFQRKFLGRDL
jgi:methylmalonyl-CoA mutase N-terminal domain/subunit